MYFIYLIRYFHRVSEVKAQRGGRTHTCLSAYFKSETANRFRLNLVLQIWLANLILVRIA
jgi:hypothetical protein